METTVPQLASIFVFHNTWSAKNLYLEMPWIEPELSCMQSKSWTTDRMAVPLCMYEVKKPGTSFLPPPISSSIKQPNGDAAFPKQRF